MTSSGSWTHPALTGAGAEAAIVLVPLGSIEVHGPHLPLETDTIIAEHLARVAAAGIEAALGLPAPIAPPITATASAFAGSFPGTISFPKDEEVAIVSAVVESIASQGAARIALVNLHFDPVHMTAVSEIVERLAGTRPDVFLFPDFTRRRHAQRIGGEFATGSCHAGEFETSLMLAAAPEKVREEYLSLPELTVDLPAAIKVGKKGFRELGMQRGYCGRPASATAGEGRRLFELLGDIVIEECSAAWELEPL